MESAQNVHKNLLVAACHRIPLRSYLPFVCCSTLFPNKNVDAKTMTAIRFYRPNDCKAVENTAGKYTKMHQKHRKLVHCWKLKPDFPMGACLRSSPRPPIQSRASRLWHWRLNLRCIGNGYDYASVSYASLFLTQVYLNFRANPPCKQKSSTYTTANIPEKLRKIDMPQVKITFVSLWRLHSSWFVYYFKQSRLNLYFASSFSQFVPL